MTKPGPSETRDVILRHAEALIRSRGYAGFSYADLSALVKITKASIHYHFPTKEHLVLATLQVYRGRYTDAFDQICREHPNALDRIEAYGRIYLNGHDQGAGCLCAALAVERDLLSPGLRTAMACFFQDHLDWLQIVYGEGVKNGQVSSGCNPVTAAQVVVSALEGALLVARALDQRDGMELVLATLRKMYCPISS
ncbi:MAG: TetR/AcrR family transcriptional regulator [Sulfitobacter sp.]